jgi:predicted site-specific integrase-resolvase
MKLSKWAKIQNIHYNTALKYYHQGKIPNAKQLDTGTIVIDENEKVNNKEELDKIIFLLEEIRNAVVIK